MSKMLMRIPSKGVQYGYVEVEAEYDGTPEGAATVYTEYVSRFQIGEINYAEERMGKKSPAPEPVAPVIKPSYSDESEAESDAAAEMLKAGLGATVVEDETAPWEHEVKQESAPWDVTPVPTFSFDWDK